MKTHFQMMAGYNRWANARLYAAVAGLPDEVYRRDVGLFFGSVHRTLNHLVLTDLIWLRRIDGKGEDMGVALDRVLYEDHRDLVAARLATDDRLGGFIDAIPEEGFADDFRYSNTAGVPFTQPLAQILAHLFNHQTHHRGQTHSGLSILGAAPPSLDMIGFHRGIAAPSPEAMIGPA